MLRPIALAVVCVLALAPAGVAVQQATFRQGVDIVRVHASVQDREGRLLTALTRGDFELVDNGRPVEIVAFSNDPQPLTLALMLQMSWSMAPHYGRLTASARHLIDALRPVDRIRVGTFTNEVAVSPFLTADRVVLDRILREEMWPYGLGLRPWAAIDGASMSLDAESGRRAVLMLTAMSGPWGDDRNFMPTGRMPTEKERARFSSTTTSEFVRRRMLERDVALYIVGFGGPRQEIPPTFRRLTEESGGGHFVLPSDADLAAAFAEVAEELRHQYVLGFIPATLDGREHRLEVRVRRAGVTARARQSYFAEASGPDTAPASPAVTANATAETTVVASKSRAPAGISAYVTMKGDRTVPSLAVGDFEVRIGGVRQPVVHVATGRDTALAIALVIDESDSLHSVWMPLFRTGLFGPSTARPLPAALSNMADPSSCPSSSTSSKRSCRK
jgi:Ca-activated chloride channel family protein